MTDVYRKQRSDRANASIQRSRPRSWPDRPLGLPYTRRAPSPPSGPTESKVHVDAKFEDAPRWTRKSYVAARRVMYPLAFCMTRNRSTPTTAPWGHSGPITTERGRTRSHAVWPCGELRSMCVSIEYACSASHVRGRWFETSRAHKKPLGQAKIEGGSLSVATLALRRGPEDFRESRSAATGMRSRASMVRP